jgi:hypothetical protein
MAFTSPDTSHVVDASVIRQSSDTSDDRCASLATAIFDYVRERTAYEERTNDVKYTYYSSKGVDSEPVLIDLKENWNIDLDNPDSARPLACALIGMLLNSPLLLSVVIINYNHARIICARYRFSSQLSHSQLITGTVSLVAAGLVQSRPTS